MCSTHGLRVYDLLYGKAEPMLLHETKYRGGVIMADRHLIRTDAIVMVGAASRRHLLLHFMHTSVTSELNSYHSEIFAIKLNRSVS